MIMIKLWNKIDDIPLGAIWMHSMMVFGIVGSIWSVSFMTYAVVILPITDVIEQRK